MPGRVPRRMNRPHPSRYLQLLAVVDLLIGLNRLQLRVEQAVDDGAQYPGGEDLAIGGGRGLVSTHDLCVQRMDVRASAGRRDERRQASRVVDVMMRDRDVLQ